MTSPTMNMRADSESFVIFASMFFEQEII
jgi:hypothetical protein